MFGKEIVIKERLYMRCFKEIVVIMIAMIALSGCAGKRTKTKPIKQQFVDSEVIKPLAKPLVLANKIVKKSAPFESHSHISRLPRNNYRLDQDKSLQVTISEYGYTRFYIEDERITDVFIYPQEDIGVRIHNQGYLVVVPKQSKESIEEEQNSSDEQIYVTVTGEHGTTQDLTLRFTGKAPEPVKFIKSNLGVTK